MREPVLASPPSTAYRIRKFVRRYRLPVAAGLAVFATLVAGGVGTTWFAISAREQADIAQQNETRANDNAKRALDEKGRADHERELARRKSYAASLSAAEFANASGNPAAAKAALEDCPEELRGFEWGHLALQIDASLSVFPVRGQTVTSIAVSGEGQRLFAGGPGGILILDPHSFKLSRHHSFPRAAPFRFTIDDSGVRIATSVQRGPVHIWDADTGKLLKQLPDLLPVEALALSSNGSKLAIGGKGRMVLIDIQSGNVDFDLPAHDDNVYAFSQDCQKIASASWGDASGRVWDAATGREVATLQGAEKGIHSLAFSPDRRWIAGAGGMDIPIWDANTGQPHKVLRGHDERVNCAVFSLDNRYVVSGSDDKTIRVWSADAGTLITVLHGHSDGIWSATFSPDGRSIISSDLYEIRLWSPACRAARA